MTDHSTQRIHKALDQFRIEIPSWGFANTGTRFGKFIQDAAATSTAEKFADAGEVFRLTGITPTVALHVLWDMPNGLADVSHDPQPRARARRPRRLHQPQPLPVAGVQVRLHLQPVRRDPPNRHPAHARLRRDRQSARIARHLHLGRRRLQLPRHAIHPPPHRLARRSDVAPRTPHSAQINACSSSTSPSSPPSTTPTSPTGAWPRCSAAPPAPRPRSSSTPATTTRAPTSSRSSPGCSTPTSSAASTSTTASTPTTTSPSAPSIPTSSSASSPRSSPPTRSADSIAFMIDQSHNLKGKMEAMIQSVVTAQELYARAALIDFNRLAELQDRCQPRRSRRALPLRILDRRAPRHPRVASAPRPHARPARRARRQRLRRSHQPRAPRPQSQVHRHLRLTAGNLRVISNLALPQFNSETVSSGAGSQFRSGAHRWPNPVRAFTSSPSSPKRSTSSSCCKTKISRMTLEAIHRRTRVSKTTVYRVLKTFAHRGYISQAQDGTYRHVSRPKKLRFGFAGQSADMPFSDRGHQQPHRSRRRLRRRPHGPRQQVRRPHRHQERRSSSSKPASISSSSSRSSTRSLPSSATRSPPPTSRSSPSTSRIPTPPSSASTTTASA